MVGMLVREYSAAFRSRMVERMVGPRAVSATALAREVGVSQPVLSRWLVQAPTVDGMTPSRKRTEKPWTGAEKWRVVLEASQCSASDLGALLRREGLHETQLASWRAAAEAALAEPAKSARGRAKPSVEAKRIQVLERELRRKDAALAETAALLVLKKKCWRSGGTSRRRPEAEPTGRPATHANGRTTPPGPHAGSWRGMKRRAILPRPRLKFLL